MKAAFLMLVLFALPFQLAAQGKPSLISPEDGATDVSTNPTFSWNTPGALPITLEVSTDSAFSSLLTLSFDSLTTDSKTVSGLEYNTTYYWRVSVLHGVGAGGGPLSESWSFTTAAAPPLAPLAPLLLLPADGATDVPTDVELSWNASLTADFYTLQVSIDSNFSALVYDQDELADSLQVIDVLENNILYYWRVSATNAGGTSVFSDARSFTTIAAEEGPLELVSPEDGATDVSVNPTFTWSHPSQGPVFTLEVSTDPEFNSLTIDIDKISGTSMSVEGLEYNTVYYWRVRLGQGLLSTVRSFKTVAAIPGALLAPFLVSPENGATDVPTSLWLMWKFSSGAVSYKLQVTTDPDFSSVLHDQSGLTDSLQQISGLENGTLYYWRVGAVDTGEVEVYSAARSFTTAASNQSSLTLLSPEDGATDVPVAPTFTWSHPSQGPVFTLEVSTDPEFSSPLIDIDKISGTSKQVEGLAYNTVYYWRVKIGQGQGSLSIVRSFKTVTVTPGALLAPLLVSPENEADDVQTALSLVWKFSSGAVAYRLQVSTEPDFSSLMFDQSGLTDSLKVISGLANDSQYYWRVGAVDTAGVEVYSAARSFTTLATNPAAPTLLSPVDGVTDIPVNPTFVWSATSQGPVFTLEVATDPEFVSLVTSIDKISGDSMQVTGLDYNTVYYWRVRKAQGQALISNVWSFTTGGSPTSVERVKGGIPETFVLHQNYPNPFNPMTTIQFSVAKESRVTLAIFNTLGAVVEVLADQTFAPGNYQVQWTPQNLASGVYFYRLQTTEFTHTRKLLLLQ